MQAWPRAIILLDMNAFFASIEQMDHPELRNRPIGVTNGKAGTCFITCSYEARAYGIHTGTRLKEARQLCPDVIQVPARPERYARISMAIMEEMKSFTPDVEVFSVDEAFLDITRCQHLGEPVEIARRIRETVYEISGGLPCSIGLSGDKTTAKFAAKLRKPNGFTVIPPWKAREALKNAPVRALCGIGPGIARFLAERGIHTCGDMQKLPIGVLAKRFGNFGRRIWYMAQGQDPAGIEKNGLPPKTIGHGKVMPPDTQDRDTICRYLRHMSEKVAERLRQHNFEAQHFFIGLLTREGWLASDRFKTGQPTRNGGEIMQLCESLLNNIWHRQGVFQCQITALDPRNHGSQFDMFAVDTTRVETLSRVMDEINWKYGALSLASAQLLGCSTMPM